MQKNYMIRKILDLHIHSKYSRACSKNLELPVIGKACQTRGIDIVATGDMTHPAWFASIKEELQETAEGMYSLKKGTPSTKFILGTEVASIKKHKGQTRRVHLLLFAPNVSVAEKFNKELKKRGYNLTADGRPILGLPSKDILQLMLEIDDRMVMIPAHAWTPWFGVFGSKGGYSSLEDAFDELHTRIFAIETGLSSNPLMNWRCRFLDNTTMVSSSDAHSPQKLGREANVLQFENESNISYKEIMRVIEKGDKNRFLQTIEFYPEEGKYHMDGHRECKVVMNPAETRSHKGVCPVCKKTLVIGVMNRVEALADRTEEEAKAFGKENKIPFTSIVPLPEIIADVMGVGVASKKVTQIYHDLTTELGNEFYILLEANPGDIARASVEEMGEAVQRVRGGNVVISPGYDGVFGTVKVYGDDERRGKIHQLGMKLE